MILSDEYSPSPPILYMEDGAKLLDEATILLQAAVLFPLNPNIIPLISESADRLRSAAAYFRIAAMDLRRSAGTP